MAWRFLDSVPDIKGPYSYSTDSATTWERALNTINSSGPFYELSNRGNTFVYVSSNNSYSSDVDGSSKVVNTSFGAAITMRNGGFTFNTNWKPPGRSGILSPGLYGLMVNESFRIVVNDDIEEAEIFLLRSFYNSPWFTCINCIMNYNQTDRLSFYQYIMNNAINYQAISYITGNNKTYNLSKILTINGGDPVSNAAPSSVNLNNDSRLDNLMSNA